MNVHIDISTQKKKKKKKEEKKRVTQRLDGLANVSFKHFIKQLNCKNLHLGIKCKE